MLAAITAQHAEITRLVASVHAADGAGRPDALHQLLAYLAGHEAVEEVLLHPSAQSTAEPEVGAERVAEEEGIGQQVQRLEDAGIDSPVFLTQFGLMEEAISQHAKAEEERELPLLLEDIDSARAALVLHALHEQASASARRTGSFAEMLETATHDVRGLAARH
ncbi:hemerythrin domain-containing protein [Intrasporangium flavum]|uniref:hemerythrin domain-containing protein n=1 Tax=Intrasporangium flavum TaxID=1428657 RepID=UPI0009700CB8|nr:hemerythrin domain-containing protein [Intrasporangium flavum]